MMRLTLPLSAVLVLLVGRPLAAQTVFVEGAAFVGIERFSSVSSQPANTFLVDLSGTTGGGRVGVGAFVAPQWSVRTELAVPSLLQRTTITQPPIVQPLPFPVTLTPQPGVIGGLIVPIPPISVTQQVRRDYRAPSVAVMVGYHSTRRHHVQVGYLGGLLFLEERQHTLVQISYTRPGIQIPVQTTDTTTLTYRAAAATGLDIDIALASRLALVPQVRADVFAGGLSVRPAVAVRWNF